MTIKALLPFPKNTCHDATSRHLTLHKQTKLPILGANKSTTTPRAATRQSSGRCVLCHLSIGNYWALIFRGWWHCLCDSERGTLKPHVGKLFPTWVETYQQEHGDSVVSAGRCHSPNGTTLNERPTCCFPRATSLPVWWKPVALQFIGPYCSRLFYGVFERTSFYSQPPWH